MAWVLAIVAGLFGAFGDSGMTRFLLYFAVGWLLVKYFQRGAIGIPAQEPVRRTPDFQEAATFRETPAAPMPSESPMTPQEARALVESLLTAGLLFNTLAVPFALSHLWTSAVWALEGAFLVWHGARQQRKTMRAFGCLLQALGYLAYIVKSPNLEEMVPWVNPVFLGTLMRFAAWNWIGKRAPRRASSPFALSGATT